jgi:four helix bundle protein
MRYRDLLVWQRGMDFVVAVYALTERLPAHERFGLAIQLRRAAVSVPSNIAEGHSRLHRGDYVHHLSMANASLAEAETQLELAVRLRYLEHCQVMPVLLQAAETGRMLSGLIRRLRVPCPPSPVPASESR